ncbi:hypothetical protein LN736_03470 [Clostridium sp. WLY-B-L2]|uniref:Uncharacterized protein n=1 Tax=Clostridium aromativorans TaxID=2836848 RepID=A0ABS8N589_9CLOT|nr:MULTISPECIES: hypothetical protein [Clostridium]MCC9293928.1 hypothetical protein [Clostridium aromativorans]
MHFIKNENRSDFLIAVKIENCLLQLGKEISLAKSGLFTKTIGYAL